MNMNMFEQMPFSEKYPVFRKLAEIGDLRKLSREELELYDEDIKNMRDIYATRKFDKKRLPGGSRTYRESPFLYAFTLCKSIKPSARFQDFYDYIL